MIIATLTRQDNGSFHGKLRTLTLNTEIRITPNTKGSNDKAPDFIISIDGIEVGAAWNKVSAKGETYISVSLDDPSFASPIYAIITHNHQGTPLLVWERSRSKDKDK